MKVLVFDEWFPWPLESGKKIRSYNLFKRLAKKHQIIYMAYAKLPEEQSKLDEMAKWCYRVIPVDDVRRDKASLFFYLDVILNMFSSKPFSTHHHILPDYKHKLDAVISSEKPDLIHCEWTNYSPYLEGIDNVPIIISSHNIESDIWKRLGLSGKNILERIIGRQQAERIEKLERYWYPKADYCLAVSSLDKKVIESYGAKADVVENGVDIDYYNVDKSILDNKCIVFTASFDTFSNQDGALFFLTEIYPLIKCKIPDVKFMLLGKNPPKCLIKYCEKDTSVQVTGTVPDVRPYLNNIMLSVVPLRIGGGSRLKILEAMAICKPVVSTTIGAEGLDVTDNENIILADDPIIFAEKVVEMLHNNGKYHAIVNSAYQFVKQNYDWDILAEKNNSIWIDTVNRIK